MSDEPAPGAVESTPPAGPAAPAPMRRPTADSSAMWLREHRLQVAIGIAIAETIFVILEADFSRVTVIVIAIPIVLFYVLAGRTLVSPLYREASWILAVSQLLAAAAAVIALVVSVGKLVLAAAIGAAVVFLLIRERGQRSGGSAE